jgi:hypothetical protein
MADHLAYLVSEGASGVGAEHVHGQQLGAAAVPQSVPASRQWSAMWSQHSLIW